MLPVLFGAVGFSTAAYLANQFYSSAPSLPPSLPPSSPSRRTLHPNRNPNPQVTLRLPSTRRKKQYCEKYFGTLQKIIIYPLDGGIPFEVKEAKCLKSGLQWGDLVDRAYVAYLPKTGDKNIALPNLQKSVIGKANIEILLTQILAHQRTVTSKNSTVIIEYLGIDMKVEDLGDDIALTAANIFGFPVFKIRIAYCPPESRLKLNADRTIPIFDAFISDTAENTFPHFSQYTLINSKSLWYINNKTGKKIPPSSFRANLVFDGPVAEFCEDDIFSLKIGRDVQFIDFEPCSHSPWSFANKGCNTPLNCQQPYQFLERTRTRKDIRAPYKNLEFPVFGRNMSLAPPEGKIKLGDELWAIIYR